MITLGQSTGSDCKVKLIIICELFCPFLRGYFEEIPICHPNVSKEAFELFDFMFTSGQGKLVNDPCTVMEVYTGIPFGGISSNPSKLVLDSMDFLLI